ncbi:MAG: hypothetical protein U9P38_05790 [Campylobacterota bacterium]|nr:hypothetical protein [Campylobacterota bacterium]
MTTIPLHSTDKGTISVTQIEKPYGEDSTPVASIGISLAGKADAPDYKVHIPMENLDAVITALQALK